MQNDKNGQNGNTVVTPEQAIELKVTLNPWAAVDAKYAGAEKTTAESTVTGPKARYVALTVGQGFTNMELITDVLTKIRDEDPNTIIISQDRFQPDKDACALARSLGLVVKTQKPKIFYDNRFRAMLNSRPDPAMTAEEQATHGYVELTNRWAAVCAELHVFGLQQGPQLGWIRSFMLAGKTPLEWMNPEQQAFRRQRELDEIPAPYAYA